MNSASVGMTAVWGNSLEKLADQLLGKLAADPCATPDEVFARRQCIVVASRVQQVWLQQRFLYDTPRPNPLHVLANCDFPLLNVFVNDWLYRMTPGRETSERDPAAHPFSVGSMQWRIYALLASGDLSADPRFAALGRYVSGAGGRLDERRCFKLASRLARLMDEYMVYRPDMVAQWEKGRDAPAAGATLWEPALWRKLTEKDWKRQSYLADFLRMDKDLGKAGIGDEYSRVAVFAPSLMPRVYLAFFQSLGKVLPVDLYLFNPARGDWFDRPTSPGAGSLENPEDCPFEPQHPILAASAKGCRDMLAATLDLTGGQVAGNEDETFEAPAPDSVLHALQEDLVAGTGTARPGTDGTLQLHCCHGPLREVEVLRDQILHCFNTMKGLQPRQIQVQVADMVSYAPTIEAVFASHNRNAADTIPFVITDRVVSGESQVAGAFRQLLDLPDSRFTAPELLALLRCDAIARAFGFDAADVDSVALWIGKAGIRWGRDSRHREKMSKARFGSETSWRHGLDRLLLGYALGREPAELGNRPLPADCVRDDEAEQLGHLARFYEELAALADFCSDSHPVAQWVMRLQAVVETFFYSDNETYREIVVLKRAVRSLATSARAAGREGVPIPVTVVREFLAGELDQAAAGTEAGGNAVVFSALRPGSSQPRRVMCVLGLADGVFPRLENRPAYDLLRVNRRLGDRSPRLEDRMAWLETLANAREKLLLFYPAFSAEDNSPCGESVVIRELDEHLERTLGRGRIQKTAHRLHGFNPDYYLKSGPLFSYSRSNYEAACVLQGGATKKPAEAAVAAPAGPGNQTIELQDLVRFFRNPAEYYYTRTLGVRLEVGAEAQLPDSETFDPGVLDEYRMRQRIIDAMVPGPGDEKARTRARRELTEQGVLPLEGWGQRKFEDAWGQVGELLEKDWPGFGTLRDALSRIKGAAKTELIADLDATTRVCGSTVLDTRAGQPRILVFRNSKPKVATRLDAWLIHLWAAAAGRDVETFVLQGRTADKCEGVRFPPCQQEEARQALIPYVSLFREGCGGTIAFTPAASLAYMEQVRKESSTQKKALEAARKAWSDAGLDGADDVYYFKHFGATGPFADAPRFEAVSRLVIDSLLAHELDLGKGAD